MKLSDLTYQNIKIVWKGLWGLILLGVIVYLPMIIAYCILPPFLKLCKGSKASKIPRIRNPILLKSATTLAEEIRTQKVKSVEVVKAFIDRIEQVNPVLNAVVEMKTDEALEEARKADLLVSNHPNLSRLAEEKPLLGIPITVKEHLSVQGFRCTCCSLLLEDKVSIKDSSVVQKLKETGAIILATTNMPQYGASNHTDNFLYGATLNPYDIHRTPGGSSGGEGSILAAAGSVIGIGSDIAGSIRCPAYCNGIFGHFPSPGSVKLTGIEPEAIQKCTTVFEVGPLCRFVEDMRLVLKVIVEPSLKPKLDLKPTISSLKIYYIEEMGSIFFGMLPVHKEVKQSLHKAINHLETNFGIKAEKLDFPSLRWISLTVMLSFWEEFKKVDFSMFQLLQIKQEDINIIIEITRSFMGWSKYNSILLWMIFLEIYFLQPAYNLFSLIFPGIFVVKSELKRKLCKDGVLLLPTYPFPAPYSSQMTLFWGNPTYTGLINVLNIPSVHCPLGLDKKGLPTGIQVASNANNDHLCLTVAEELQNEFGGWVSP